ncbi:MAG: GIY-YIG nuclease family protein [Desulfacinum sp.]|nr:GIY-YIG nuclease family protein [Desulfacinum sp.]
MWFVYICLRRGRLYTGITTHLQHRMAQHKAKLLYYETHPDRFSAARREKQIKGWTKGKKLALCQSPENPLATPSDIPAPANPTR